MGYHKHLLRQLGYRDYNDFEVQSGIHEFGHLHEGYPEPSMEDQMTFLRGLKQQIENDPNISDADKYRRHDKQPGMITRIDQEMARLKTGKDEHGRPLESKNRMRGQDLAAMQRLGVLLKRNQEAKGNYFDVYARSMGVDAATARARWKELVSRQAPERENTKIRLTDKWRDNLAVAGFTARHQADIGQSNVSREALRIMEEERRAKLDSLDTRPSISSAQRISVPARAGGNVQCTGEGGCGQFGHERNACPNQALVQQREGARKQWRDLDAQIRKDQAAKAEALRTGDAAQVLSPAKLAEMRRDRDVALRHDHQITQTLAADGRGQAALKCETCGQFGHEYSECPNGILARTLEVSRSNVDRRVAQMQLLSQLISEAQRTGNADEEKEARSRYDAAAEAWAQEVAKYRDLRADIAAGAMRCIGGCGQFGHTREECPNAALLDEVEEHRRAVDKIREKVHQRARLRGLDPATAPLTEADDALYDDWYAKGRELDQRVLDAGMDPNQVSTLPPPPSGPVSSRIQEVGYNPDTGYLEVTTRPYTRKSDGQVMPAKTYAYRMSPSEYRQMMAASSLTSYVSQSVWAKDGSNTSYQFENTAEAIEAAVQRKCPTCGQWASMTSAHTCPVRGSSAGQDDNARRARIKAEKKAARATGRAAQMPPQLTRVPTGAVMRDHNAGIKVDYAHPNQVDNALAAGRVAHAEVRASFLNATVSGRAVAWNDADGQAKLSTDREDGAVLQCTCRAFKKNGRCNHIRVAGAAMANRYGADHPAVGSPLRTAPLSAPEPVREQSAKDAPEAGFQRMSYAQIRQRRADMRADGRAQARQSAEAGDRRWLRAAGAVDGRTGARVRTPCSWTERAISAEPAKTSTVGAVRLDQHKEVQDGIRAGLRSQTGKHWAVTRKKDGWTHITTALKRRIGDHEMTMRERVELARVLKLPVEKVSAHGVSVPPDNGWRAEFLDRAHGKPPRVLGERFVARADQRREIALNV